MPSKFTIEISAVDKATATVKKVNDAMGKVTRPFEDAHKAFGRFDAALAENPIAKSLGKISKAGLGAARSIGRIAAPVAAITGVTSIAGVTMLADRWARFGRATTYAAQGIGISTSKLQQYQGVATLAGVSTEGMVSSLQGLGTTMEDARWGRNQGALMMLHRIGIGLKKTKSGAWDVNAEFKAINRVMNKPGLKNNPQAQSLVAGVLQVSAALPLLRQSTAAYDKYASMQKRLGYISSPRDIANANAFALSLAGMKISAEGLGQSIMDKATPAIRPFISDLSKWIGKNRELIGNDVAGWVKEIATGISKVDWKATGTRISGFFTTVEGSASTLKVALDDVVDAFHAIHDTYSGTKYLFRPGGAISQVTGFGKGQFTSADNAAYSAEHGGEAKFQARQAQMLRDGSLVSLAAFKKNLGWMEHIIPNAKIRSDYRDYLNNYTANSFLNPSNRPTAFLRGGTAKTVAAVKFFEKQGWTSAQAAGIAANLGQESAFNPGAKGDFNKKTGKFDAYGLGQWHADRQANFARWAGHSIRGSTADEQMRFVQYELTQGSEKAAGDRLRQTKTAREAGAAVSLYYERPSAQLQEAISRGSDAASINAGPYSSGVASTKPSKVHVEVALKNAPPGTTAKATATGNATTSPPLIGYSAVGFVP